MSKLPLHKESHSFRARQRRVEEEQRRQRSTSPFQGTGMSPTADGGIDVDGTMNVGGELNVTGNTVIGGTLSLPAGIIDNQALAAPVVMGAANRNTSGFALGSSFAEVVGLDVTVPSGCTSALVNLSVWMQGYNQNTTGGSDGTGSDFLYVYAKIASTSGQYNANGVSGNGGTTTTSGGLALPLSGLTPGNTVRLGAWGSCQYTTIAASAYNTGTLTASIVWLR